MRENTTEEKKKNEQMRRGARIEKERTRERVMEEKEKEREKRRENWMPVRRNRWLY